MRLNLLNISQRAAALGFLALFPGFLLYQYSLAQGWIPAFLGGEFGVVSLFLAALCLLLLPWILARQLGRALLPGVVVVLLICYCTIWAFTNYFIVHEPYSAEALQETAAALGTWLAVLLVGLFFPFRRGDTGKWLWIAGVLIVLALLHAMIRFRSPLGPYLTFSGVDDDAQVSTYQGIGRSILVTSIFISAIVKRTNRRVLVLAIGSVLILLVGSRSDFFTLAAVTAVVVLLVIARRINPITIATVILGGWLLVHFTAPIFLHSRNAELLDLSSSSSWQARQELEVAALHIIAENPVYGTFGYHFRDGGAGFYAHNALSAWTNFGLPGFILYTGLIGFFTLVSFWKLISGEFADPVWFAAFQLNLAGLIIAVGAQPVFAPLPILGWGVALNALRSRAAQPEESDQLATV